MPTLEGSEIVDLELIERLLGLMKAEDLAELEWQDGEVRVRLARSVAQPASPPVVTVAPSGAPIPQPAPELGQPTAPAAEAVEQGVRVFTAPMVGTYYSAPNPDAEPYSEPGDHLQEDSVLCILEAMKVMNEITADCSGELLEILVENGEPVEFGQPLFKIRLD